MCLFLKVLKKNLTEQSVDDVERLLNDVSEKIDEIRILGSIYLEPVAACVGDEKFLAGVRWCIDRRLKLFGLAEAAAPPGDEPPGTVLEVDRSGIVVRCGSLSAVLIGEVQREGRRRMPIATFLIGDPVAPGERLG